MWTHFKSDVCIFLQDLKFPIPWVIYLRFLRLSSSHGSEISSIPGSQDLRCPLPLRVSWTQQLNLNMARVMGCHFQNEVAKTDFQLALTLPDPLNIPLWWSQVPCCDGEVHVARNPDGLAPAHEELRPSSPRVMSNWILRTTLWVISGTDPSPFEPRWWQPQPLSWLQLGRDPEFPAVPPRVLIQRDGEKIKSQSLEG